MIETEKINKIFEIRYGQETSGQLKKLIKDKEIIKYKIYDEFLINDYKIVDIQFKNSEIIIIFENWLGERLYLTFRFNQLLDSLQYKVQNNYSGILVIWNYLKKGEKNPLANIYLLSLNQITALTRFIDFLLISRKDALFD